MADVRTMPVPAVTTAGVERDALQVEVSRQIPALGQGHVGVPGGLLAATAGASMSEPGDVSTVRKWSPWRRQGTFPPRDGDTAQIDVDGQRRFTGWVEDVDGSAHGPLSVGMVDVVDRLHRPMSIDPLASMMPHSLDTLTGVGRIDQIGLRAEWYVYQAMRTAGFHPIQRPHASARRHVPMVGSLIASDGAIPTADPDVQNIMWVPAPWGLAARGVTANWPVSNVNHDMFEYSFFITGPDLATTATTVGMRGSAGFLSRVRVSFPAAGLIRFTATDWLTSQDITVTVPRDDTKPVRFTRTAPNWSVWYGETQVIAPQTQGNTWVLQSISVAAEAGSQVAVGPIYVGPAGQSVDAAHVPDATIRCGPLLTTGPGMTAGPYLENRNALDLLADVARAQAAAVWLAPTGHLYYVHPDVLEAQTPTATITAAADLLDMSWTLSVRDVRRRVYVSCRHPEVQVSNQDNIILYEGPRETHRGLTASVSAWATPEGNIEWLTHASESVSRRSTINQGATNSARNRSREKGTWVGSLVIIGTGEDSFAPYMGSTNFTIDRVTSQALRYTQRVTVDPDEADAVAFRVPRHYFQEPAWEDMAHWNGVGLPILRGMGKVQWSTTRYTASMTGPLEAADYEHDSGPWTQGRCQALADWLGARMTQPRPLIQELPIVYREDLELGQTITLVEDEVYDITLTCLIVGLRERHTPEGGAQMWVTLRALDGEGLDHLYSFGDAVFGAGPYGGN